MTHFSTAVTRWCSLTSTAFAVALTLFAADASAGAREQAKRMHDRIAGVPPSDAVLTEMQNLIQSGNVAAAANVAMNNPAFYDVTLKNWITPWTNRDFSVFEPLNDYTATVIGIVRDDIDFREILSGDIVYVGTSATGAPAYAVDNNNHYEFLENNHINLADPANFARRKQSELNPELPDSATAGVWTTRQGAKAFFIDGTNRRQFRYTLVNHLCKDLDQLKDTTRVPDRIRQDVSRSPGGDSRIFLNSCIGCHSGMDPLAQAFAYYNFTYDFATDPEGMAGRISYNANDSELDPDTGLRVVKKYHINSATFKPGFKTLDDNWENYWREGPNKLLGVPFGSTKESGWNATPMGNGSGSGAKSMGMELAYSDQFARCQAEKVFKLVCLRNPVDANDRGRVETMIGALQSSGFKLKTAVASAADYCKGD